jgi:hypothetical protein
MWGSVQIEYVIDFVFHAGIGSDWLDNVLEERKRKEVIHDPPKDAREYMRKILNDFGKPRPKKN